LVNPTSLQYPPAAKCSLESSPLTAELDPRQPHYQIREENFIDGGVMRDAASPQSASSSTRLCRNFASWLGLLWIT
jgi:hypothetical protein